MSAYVLRASTTLLLCFAFGVAVSQTVLGHALQDLTRYYAAAATLIANAISGVNRVEAAQIPQNARGDIREELKKISFEISMLRSAQMPLVSDLSEYIADVRARKLEGERRTKAWGEIVYSVNRVSQLVKTTLEVVETSRWLSVTLDVQDRLALREVLLSRASLLQKFKGLPAPSTDDEIDQIDKMNRYYIQLIKSLGDLNVALARATDRLKLE